MPSRQTAYNRRKSLATLNALIGSDPPLAVRYNAAGRFELYRPGGAVLHIGRYEVIHAWITGYLYCHAPD